MCGGGSHGQPRPGRAASGGGKQRSGVKHAAVAGGSSPPAVCSADPGSVPLVMDTIPPASVSVQTELDPTANPSGVALQGVTVP